MATYCYILGGSGCGAGSWRTIHHHHPENKKVNLQRETLAPSTPSVDSNSSLCKYRGSLWPKHITYEMKPKSMSAKLLKFTQVLPSRRSRLEGATYFKIMWRNSRWAIFVILSHQEVVCKRLVSPWPQQVEMILCRLLKLTEWDLDLTIMTMVSAMSWGCGDGNLKF